MNPEMNAPGLPEPLVTNELCFSTAEIDNPYPGYPSTRLVMPLEQLTQTVDFPDGPWQHRDVELPTPAEQTAFQNAGYTLDAKGRPLHPNLEAMATDPSKGVVTGKGNYYHWGPNYTADPVVITSSTQPRVLLIKRGDTGAWALPGGFLDPNDFDASTAATRELEEETGLVIKDSPTHVYSGVVGDARATAHAWAETSAYVYRLQQPVPVSGQDDATDAGWFRLDKLDETLFGSHKFLIEQAVAHINLPTNSVLDVLTKPNEELITEHVNAGHMAYDHIFIDDGTSKLFVKRHLPERFSDPFREAHSRQYLQKEAESIEYVAQKGFSFIPERVELVNDTVLAMDALHTAEGWKWRAPKNEQFSAYVEDSLLAFQQLQQIPTPNQPHYHEHINPTYPTLWKEGWDELYESQLDGLIAKITELTSNWRPDQQLTANDFMEAIPQLLEESKTVSRNPDLFTAHNDARQSNIAWHPDHHTRLVDWSWFDPAPRGADETMFLTDLAKSGHDITEYLEHINKDHLLTLVGFWLAHSLWQTRDGSTTVREHQVASAITGWHILQRL